LPGPFRPSTPLPELAGARPPEPAELMRLHRLCLHAYGLLCRDVEAQAQALARTAGGLRKKHRVELADTLAQELPVLIALHAMDRLASHPRLARQGLAELVRSLLLPLFAMSYRRLYERPADPLKHVLDRLDWYLDGDKGEPVAAFSHFLATAWGERLPQREALVRHLEYQLLPEMDRRLDLAFRYEFG
jgi:hypothetical protein